MAALTEKFWETIKWEKERLTGKRMVGNNLVIQIEYALSLAKVI